MYDELVKQLRDNAEFLVKASSGCLSNSFADTMCQAADAIEELSMRLHGDEAAIAGMKREIERMVVAGNPRWIPVTEQLPEQNVPCIVYNKYYGPMVGWRVDGKRFRIPGSHFPDHPTHWMPLPEPPKEAVQDARDGP